MLLPFSRCAIASVVAAGATVSAASGAIIFETEPNDTIATADNLGSLSFPGGGFVVDGSLTPGDVDWFGFTLDQPASLLLAQLGSADTLNDGQFQLVDGSGTDVLAFDDDSAPGFLPALNEINLAAGSYFIGVSGFPDADGTSVVTDDLFDGLDANGDPHPESFDYKLSIAVNLIPSPGAAGLLAIAGVVGIRRRR